MKSLKIKAALNRKILSDFVCSAHKDWLNSPVWKYPTLQVIRKWNFLFAKRTMKKSCEAVRKGKRNSSNE